jgi:hypothetical protein
VRDNLLKLAPSCIQDALVESTFCCRPVRKIRSILILFGLGTLADIRDLKLFKDNGLMLLDELLGLFVMKVPSLIGNLTVGLRYRFMGFLPAMRTVLLSG